MDPTPVKIKWWQIYKTFGCYDPAWNRKIHGGYNPSINYSFNDVHWTKVKLGDLPSWIMRRNYDPRSILAVAGRWFHRIDYKTAPLRTGGNLIIGIFFLSCMVNAVNLYPRCNRHHRLAKYHW